MSPKSTQNNQPPTTSPQNPNPPFIISFFSPQTRARDPSGRSLDTILAYTDAQLSRHHDFIQYLFPLPEKSPVNPWAPLIDRQVYDAFRDSQDLRAELLRGFGRMLGFYGFTLSTSASGSGGVEGQVEILPAQNFKAQSKLSWRRGMDHNHLRLTRMIRCLRVLSCEREARALYRALLEFDEGGVVRGSSRMFWARAAERALWLPPDEPDGGAEGIQWLREACAVGEKGGERGEGEGQMRESRTAESNGEVNGEEGGDVDLVDEADASLEETNLPADKADEGGTRRSQEQRTTGHSGTKHVNADEADTKVGMRDSATEGQTNKD